MAASCVINTWSCAFSSNKFILEDIGALVPLLSFRSLNGQDLGVDAGKSVWPGWQSTVSARGGQASDRDKFAPTMDSVEETGGIPHPSFDKN